MIEKSKFFLSKSITNSCHFCGMLCWQKNLGHMIRRKFGRVKFMNELICVYIIMEKLPICHIWCFFLVVKTNVLWKFRKFIKYVKKFGKIEEKPCCLTSLNHFFTDLIYVPGNHNLVIDFITNSWCKQTQQKFCQAYCKSGLGHLGKNWLKRTSEERAGLAKKSRRLEKY